VVPGPKAVSVPAVLEAPESTGVRLTRYAVYLLASIHSTRGTKQGPSVWDLESDWILEQLGSNERRCLGPQLVGQSVGRWLAVWHGAWVSD